jgi:hypothetical protein
MKYWVYINNEIKGPFEKEELIKLDGFNKDTLICPQSPVEEETKEWKEASQFPEIFELLNLNKEEKPVGDKPDTSKLQSSTLNVSDKDNIMIERFNINDAFNVNNDVNLAQSSAIDPLTLSQIRRKQFSEVSGDKKTEEQNKEEKVLEEKKENVEEYKEKVVEFTEKPKEFSLSVDELQIENNLKSSTDTQISEVFDKESFKKDILDEIERKMGSFITKDEFEAFKSEIKSYIDEKLDKERGDVLNIAERRDINDLLKHLEIDVKDIKTRIEGLEKKVNISSSSRVSYKEEDGGKTIVMENKSKESAKTSKGVFKIIGTFILIMLSIGSILFVLRQFGIFDVMSFFGGMGGKKISSDNGLFSTSQTTSTASEVISSFTLTSPTMPVVAVSTTSLNQPPIEDLGNKKQESQNKSLNDIIQTVKDYKIATNINLEKTIKRVIKSKNIKFSEKDINWYVKQNGDTYRVDVVVSAKPKNIVFKFDFDDKKMYLKPLNTLAINTLKMMMGKKSDKKTTKKYEKDKTIKSEEFSDEKKEKINTTNQNTNVSSKSETEEEYLIIGE